MDVIYDLVAAAEHVAQAVGLVDDVVDAHVVLAAVVVQRHAPGAVHYVLLVGVPGAQFDRKQCGFCDNGKKSIALNCLWDTLAFCNSKRQSHNLEKQVQASEMRAIVNINRYNIFPIE